ncbi:MFS transporter [Nocardia goodfellowii]|uniref:Benzoate transport n=1 Tax=Nocardia goodfellowii TaxID=882446 RepID=A0ABS4QLV2_9NOCA|nr:MFS transporter [Nocardia goodfellowii]MBP2192125.1 benzoate transport [Nocardia goodfellowii]
MSTAVDIKSRIESAPMRPLQYAVVTVCVLLNMLDGFDVLALAFSASHISEEWSLSGAQLGILLSAALFGMAAGSILVAQVADIAGRRRTIVVAAVVVAAGMALSALATGFVMLLVVRVVTGIAIGTLQACLNVMVAEYSSARHRSIAISFYTAGQPIGGTLGGIAAGVLLAHFEWRAVFAAGAIATLCTALLAAAVLPESVDFLLTRRPRDALARTNTILSRLRLPELTELPPASSRKNAAAAHWRDITTGPTSVTTLLLGFSFFVLMAGFYFANSWTPKLVTSSGFSTADGVQAGVCFSAGGIVGALAFGPLAMRFGVRPALTALFGVAGFAFALYALSMGSLPTALIAAVVLGMATSAVMAGMFSIGPMYYSASARATAVGLIIGIGRVGAIFSPIIAGALIDLDWAPKSLYFLFFVPLIAGAVAVYALRGRQPVLADSRGAVDTAPLAH